ncbi:MAG: hypothetical protein MZV70_60100 [Desulfobacterales bacterium]|nr:hypothetical protein [Desulfobacterales bacterium]
MLADIEKRSNAAGPDPCRLKRFSGAVSAGSRIKSPRSACAKFRTKYIALIREKLGAEIIEALEPGKLGAGIPEPQTRTRRRMKKIAVLLEQDDHALKTAQASLREVDRLTFARREMAESQIAALQELELFEQSLRHIKWLVDIQLGLPLRRPWAGSSAFSMPRHLEVYLFDDDKFLTADLNTDGKIFTV